MNKLFRRISLYSILTVAVSVAVLAQQPAQFSTERLRIHVTHLASDELEGRRTGTPGAERAGQYIAKEFKRLGLRPGVQTAQGANGNKAKSDYLQHFSFAYRGKDNVHGAAPVQPTREPVTLTGANVIGILEGSDPVLKNEAIVIGAHYDHLGRGGSGSLAQREGGIHHGADDNASGVAGIIELARTFTAQRPKPRRTIVFIAFSGEEEGLLGSDYYVNHPVVPIANTIAMINLDMIGRLKNRNLIIGGVGTAQEWRSMIETANLWQGMTVTAAGSTTQGNGLPVVVAANGRPIVTNDSSKSFVLTLNDDGFGPSDHASFYKKQIPVLFFWTGTHEDYHKPSDTADKINYDGETMVLGMIGRIVRALDANDKRPTYAVAKSESTGRTGFRVYLGTIPNYADTNEGLLLDGVRDDSPAAKAGLKAGDRVVKLAGRNVRNIEDYTAALGEMKAGQEYEIEIVRGTERLKLKLTPAARR